MKYLPLALLAASSASLFAATPGSATASADIAVQIVSPITLVSNGSLNFGKVVVADPAQAVVVKLSPNNNDSFSCDATYTNGAAMGAAPSVPFFHARYDEAIGWAGLSITADPSVTLATGVVVVPQVDLTHVQMNCVLASITPGPGQDASHFPVGGTLTADPGIFGVYSGKFNVTVAYN